MHFSHLLWVTNLVSNTVSCGFLSHYLDTFVFFYLIRNFSPWFIAHKYALLS